MSNIKIKNKIWITWEVQRRSVVLSEQFGAKLYMLECKSKSRIFRYFYLTLKTLKVIAKEKASYVFCQNPSIVLALLLCIVKVFFGYVLVVDRHSNFIIDSTNQFITKCHDLISDITLKCADFTIVTNKHLQEFVNSKGGDAFVLQDKLPNLDLGNKIQLQGKYNITFITSCSFDEPLEEVLSAFEGIDSSINLYITGNHNNSKFCSEYILRKPDHIHFTGFLKESDYQNLLVSSDALIVLTRFEYILTCGAYEGVALCKPLVLSNTKTIREYFSAGAVYCEPEPESIQLAVEKCLNNLPILKMQIADFKTKIEVSWDRTYNHVVSSIFQLHSETDCSSTTCK